MKTRAPKRFPSSRRLGGFTLVEVIMSMGIVAFSMVIILGLQVVGLDHFNRSIDTNVRAQITKGLMGSVKQTSFSNLPSLNGEKRYYDNQGFEVTDPGKIAGNSFIYQANLEVQKGISLPSSLPSSDPAASPATLATVRAWIINRKSSNADFQFSILVSNNGL